MTDSIFKQLTENLKNLEELTLERQTLEVIGSMSANAVVEFLKSHHNVKQLNVISKPEHDDMELQDKLKEDWVLKINGNDLCFKHI